MLVSTPIPVFYMLETIDSGVKLKKKDGVTYADPGVLEGLVGGDPFGRVNR